MGAYLNPTNGQTKEQWLAENAEAGPNTAVPEKHDAFQESGLVFVCLVNNGAFTAAGIAFDERELADFDGPEDYRPKLWYLVHKDKLMDHSNLATYMS